MQKTQATTGTNTRSITIAIVGSGGDGVALLGDLLLRIAADKGLYGMLVQSYGPQIRGGESAVVLRLATEEVHYEGDHADVLLCFHRADLARFQGTVRLHASSIVILDSEDRTVAPVGFLFDSLTSAHYTFATVVDGVEVAGPPKNMRGLAVLCRALGWSAEDAHRALQKRFATRPKILEGNWDTFRAMWDTHTDVPALPHLPGSDAFLDVETGNEAVARGAIAAGCRFFAGYPITPSSEIMEKLMVDLPRAGGQLVQAEDEIAALGMVVGASFGGVPSMTATSGPGLSLMTEMIGLSSMAEIPVVIVDCQRAGPATGIPSRTEQSDLFHAVYGGHGDFPRAVLGIFDVVHAREAMWKAFTLSETYQLPVIVLSDAYIAQRRHVRASVQPHPEPPRRTVWHAGDAAARFSLDSPDGVSPFHVPGAGGMYMAAGLEHTADGSPSSDTVMHQRMNAKRFQKLETIARETATWYRAIGRPDAPHGLVGWGSQAGLLHEWVRAHPDFRAFLPEIIHPFPLEGFAAWRRGLVSLSVVELSYQGQLHRYLSGLTDMSGVHSLARSGGAPLALHELEHLLAEARA